MLPLLLGVALAEPLTLPSGLRVALEPVAGESQIQMELRILAGAAEDPPGRSGLAHMAEHVALMAPGGGGSPVPEVELDGVTSHDDTRFLARLPPEALASALVWARETLSAPREPLERAFEAERAVVSREALRATVEEPALRGLALYPPGHPYHLPAAGQPEVVAGLTLADAQGFARTWYRPDAAILVLAGHLPEGALEAVHAALDGLPASTAPPPVHAAPPARAAAWPSHHEGPGSERALFSLATFPPTVDAGALDLLAAWMQARLRGGGWRVRAGALRHRLGSELIVHQVPPAPGGLLAGPGSRIRRAEARVRTLRREIRHLEPQQIAQLRAHRSASADRSAAAVAALTAEAIEDGPARAPTDDDVLAAARAWADARIVSLVLGP